MANFIWSQKKKKNRLVSIGNFVFPSYFQYYTPDGMPTRHLEDNTCAVCGDLLFVRPDQPGVIENTYKLNCNHE